jgi:alkanesulfonate monooxygenase SsuD/methylene tetrahydromethanopterin reductase-like flavin-dependent oxidoreductase (luciferase family)
VSKIVLASIVTSRPILDQIGIVLPPSLREHLDSTGWRFPQETAAEAAALLPDYVVDAFAVYGTPADCVARLRQIRACGINHVCFVLFPPEGATLTGMAQLLSAEVVSELNAGTQ